MKRILLLTVAIALVSCGKKNEAADAPVTETTAPADATPEETETPAEATPDETSDAPAEPTEEDKARICGQPIARGTCKAELKRFGYDAEKNVCEQFTYPGCGGTENSCRSREACEAMCEKSAE